MFLPPPWRPLSYSGALVLSLTACSSSNNTDPAKSALEAQTRDTVIHHEPCDGNSSGAVKVDVKGNGRPAIIHVMSGGHEVCRILDLNMDGAPDAFIYYDSQGRERRREQDFDRDGRADQITIFENGVVKLKMLETNFDNKIDTWDFYENGRLVKRERDSDGDGIVDGWWTFNNPTNPKCAIVAVDRNGDGKPDPESVVDLCGDAYGTPKASPTPSAPLPAPGAPGAPGALPAPGTPPGPGAPGSAAPSGSPAPAASPAAPSSTTTAPAASTAPAATTAPPPAPPTPPAPTKK